MKVTFVNHQGVNRTVDVPGGTSLVEAAIQNNVPGIEAECGGACSCATCHVLVSPEWVDKLTPVSMHENDMLDFLDDKREPNSRLGCQIRMSEAIDGLVVMTPEEQG